MKPCQGIAGRLFGHNYEARYSSERTAPDAETVAQLVHPMNSTSSMDAAENLVAASDEKEVYHLDICTRCGDAIKPEVPNV
jgi:hypothetical protein